MPVKLHLKYNSGFGLKFKRDMEAEVQADGEGAWAWNLPGEGGRAGSWSSGEEDAKEVI